MLRAYYCCAWLCLVVIVDGIAFAAQDSAKKNELSVVHQALIKCLDLPSNEQAACRTKLQPQMDIALRALAQNNPNSAEALKECFTGPPPKSASAGAKCRVALSKYLSAELAAAAPTSAKPAEAPPPVTVPASRPSEAAPRPANDSAPVTETPTTAGGYPSAWILVALPLFVLLVAAFGLGWLYVKHTGFVEAVDERERQINQRITSVMEAVKKQREIMSGLRNQISNLERGGRDSSHDPPGNEVRLFNVPQADAIEYTGQPLDPQAHVGNLRGPQAEEPKPRPMLPWNSAAEALGAAMKKLYQERVAINPDNAHQKILSAVASDEIRDFLQGYQLTLAFYYFNGRLATQGGDLIFAYLADTPGEAGWAFPVPRQVGAPSTLAWFEAASAPANFRPAKARASNGDVLECLEKGQLALS